MWRIVTKKFYTGRFQTREDAVGFLERKLGFKVVAGCHERTRRGQTEYAYVTWFPEYQPLSIVLETEEINSNAD
ncbi:MAG: hypothetical protein WAX85_00835 [Minisyncoccia bacterium]